MDGWIERHTHTQAGRERAAVCSFFFAFDASCRAADSSLMKKKIPSFFLLLLLVDVVVVVVASHSFSLVLSLFFSSALFSGFYYYPPHTHSSTSSGLFASLSLVAHVAVSLSITLPAPSHCSTQVPRHALVSFCQKSPYVRPIEFPTLSFRPACVRDKKKTPTLFRSLSSASRKKSTTKYTHRECPIATQMTIFPYHPHHHRRHGITTFA